MPRGTYCEQPCLTASHHLATAQPAHISTQGPLCGPFAFLEASDEQYLVVRANDQAEPSLVVFGRDDAGKPRASWFDAGSADLASKAADLMKMRVLRVETEEQKAVARQLAPGRVFASGRAFTPFARTAVFSQLVELAGDGSDPSTKGSTSGKPGAVASNGSAASGDQGPGPAPTAPADPKGGRSRPQSWDDIGIGSVVLAAVGVEDGWWESIIIGVNGEALTLKWRAFPREPVFVRRRTELALLPAVTT